MIPKTKKIIDIKQSAIDRINKVYMKKFVEYFINL